MMTDGWSRKDFVERVIFTMTLCLLRPNDQDTVFIGRSICSARQINRMGKKEGRISLHFEGAGMWQQEGDH